MMWCEIFFLPPKGYFFGGGTPGTRRARAATAEEAAVCKAAGPRAPAARAAAAGAAGHPLDLRHGRRRRDAVPVRVHGDVPRTVPGEPREYSRV
eukprot:gene13620-biopygen20051